MLKEDLQKNFQVSPWHTVFRKSQPSVYNGRFFHARLLESAQDALSWMKTLLSKSAVFLFNTDGIKE